MSYGVNLSELSRQTAIYAAKILKGAKPAELPVEQPTNLNWSSISRLRMNWA